MPEDGRDEGPRPGHAQERSAATSRNRADYRGAGRRPARPHPHPSRTRAADHNTPGRPIAVMGIWKRAGGGTRGRAKKRRSPGGFKAGGDADPQDHKDRGICSGKRLGGDRRARAECGMPYGATSGAAPPRPTARLTPKAALPMPYHPVAATAPIWRNAAGVIPAERDGLWACAATTSAPHPFCQNPTVRTQRRPPGQSHDKKNGVSCWPYRRWPAHS